MAMVVEGQVEALYTYSYDAADGRKVTFSAGETFTLLSKANEDWWHVKRNGEKPMYVPANYVRELASSNSQEKQEDQLVMRTNNIPPGNDRHDDDEANNEAVFEDDDSNKPKDHGNEERPKVLSLGVRSLAKSLQNSGEPIRGSISSSNSRSKSQSLPTGWVIATDEESGRPYYYNSKTSETSWKPPRVSRVISYESEAIPLGWHVRPQSSSEELMYYNDDNDETWGRSVDEDGKVYYFNVDGTETSWELPLIQSPYRQSFEALDVTRARPRSPSVNDRRSKTRSLLPMYPRTSSRDLPPPPEICVHAIEPLNPGHQRTESCQSTDSLSSGTEEFWPPPPPPDEFSSMTQQIMAQTVERQSLFSRKKITESGNKKAKKTSWSSTFVVLFSSNLVFYKDQKTASAKPGLPHGKPESSCELRGAALEWAPSSATRKKNAFQISAVSGLQLILQNDNQNTSSVWFNSIAAIIKRLNEEDTTVVGSVQERSGSASGYESDDDDHSAPSTPTLSLSPGGFMRSFSKRRAALDDNKSNIKDKLRKLITRRPTIEELEKQGILKEQTFGCPIQHLCEREKTNVPKFVSSCIKAIEGRGLTFDGLYRVCGNVSLVQRIRISVDQEDHHIELGDSPFDDVHALTGSLKLYFRELPEPLVPFDFFSGFVEAIKQNTRNSKLDALKGLVGQLPKINYETLRHLLAHLTRVTSESEENRMHAQNLAIVWGPNMMRPRYEATNIAMNMVYQNQIVEFLLLEYNEIFK